MVSGLAIFNPCVSINIPLFFTIKGRDVVVPIKFTLVAFIFPGINKPEVFRGAKICTYICFASCVVTPQFCGANGPPLVP